MRKLVLILASLLIGMVSMAQDISSKELAKSSDAYFDINKNITYDFFYGSETADTIVASETWSRDYVVKNMYDALKQQCRVHLDSVSGSPSVTVTLEGKFSTNDSYTSIATGTWAGTSSDTTIILEGTTAVPYRIYNFKAVADGTTQKVQIERVELGVHK